MVDFIEPALFAILTIAIVAAGAGVVLANRITTSALLMAFTFLILYGVMFTPQSPRAYGLFFQTQKYWAALFVVPIAIFVALVAFSFRDSATLGAKGGDLLPLATSVFRDFAFPFEVASVLLLAAMVGAIVLVKRDED